MKWRLRHPQIPNVAFAGYNLGKDVPRLTATLNVQDFGAFPDTPEDSSGKFNAALDAAGHLGGGVVRIPAGTYQLDGVVLLGSNGVVLQGDGSNKTILRVRRSLQDIVGVNRSRYDHRKSAWSWSGGIIWICPDKRHRDFVDRMQRGAWPRENWLGDRGEDTQMPPGSRSRATRTTSSRNSIGYGLGTATPFQAASQQARSGVTEPCSSPLGDQGQWQSISDRAVSAAGGLPAAVAVFALARLCYQTIKVFYRRSVESWVARTNLEAMLGTELVDPDASGHPRLPSRSGGWLPRFERAEIEDAVRSAPDAEALVVEVTRVGDTLRFARRTMLIFVFVAIVFAVACLLIATR